MHFRDFQKISFVASAAIMFACTSGETGPTGEQKEFLTESEPLADSVIADMPLSDSIKTELGRFFSPESVQGIADVLNGFSFCDTDTAFQEVYAEAMTLILVLNAEFENPPSDESKRLLEDGNQFALYEKLKTFNGVITPLVVGCVAECTLVDFSLDLKWLALLAKETRGMADDEFMELLLLVEGDYGYAGRTDFKVWDVPYWDYGGANRLGDGIVLEVVKMLQRIHVPDQLFADALSEVHDDVFQMLSSDHAYEFSHEEVLAEYTKILRLNYFTGDELDAILRQVDMLRSAPDKYQFNCSTGDCVFG